jgi:hypothetical protein
MDPQNPNSAGNLVPANPNLAPQPNGVESLPVGSTPEAAPTPVAEMAASTAAAPSMPIPAVIPQNPVPAPVVTTTPAAQPISGPLIADDVDVIEKEWVEKAEQIVQTYSADPYAEEEAVEDLQIDYLKKRYGKVITKPEASGAGSQPAGQQGQTPPATTS